LNTETNSFDLLKALKRAEPLGFLASLSLVISAFSFEGLGNLYKIYDYSVVSAFMFIFSFLFSIVTDCFISTKISQRYPILRIPILRILQAILNYGIYFFLIIGILFLILIAYQFGQAQPQIFTITNAFLGSFVFFILVISLFKMKGSVRASGSLIFYLIEIVIIIGVILVASLSISNIIESVLDIKGITIMLVRYMFNSIFPIFGLCFGVLILIASIQILMKRRLKTISRSSYGIIIFFIIVGATFMVLSSITLLYSIPLLSNTE
jgi:hypothetical protein